MTGRTSKITTARGGGFVMLHLEDASLRGTPEQFGLLGLIFRGLGFENKYIFVFGCPPPVLVVTTAGGSGLIL